MFNQINSVHIGGVRIDNVDMKESVQKIIDLIGGKEKHQISTPNLDFLYNASKNHQFRKILNSTFLNIPDGKPLILAAKRESIGSRSICKYLSGSSKKKYLHSFNGI